MVGVVMLSPDNPLLVDAENVSRSNDFNALGDMALSFQKRGCSVRFKQRSDWNARSKILEIQCLRWL
jgi:hypothetical protein